VNNRRINLIYNGNAIGYLDSNIIADKDNYMLDFATRDSRVTWWCSDGHPEWDSIEIMVDLQGYLREYGIIIFLYNE